MNVMDERRAKVGKLPKWAQQHIQTLEANAEYYKNKLTENSIENSRVVVRHNFDTLQGVGEADIRFDLNREPGRRENVIEVSLHDDHLKAMSLSGQAILVQPQSSNLFKIKTGEWW